MNSQDLSADLAWQMNRESLTDSEKARKEPSRYLDRVNWRPIELRPVIYAEGKQPIIYELLVHWVWRNLKLDLSDTVEVGSIQSFAFVRVKGRTFAEYNCKITELDRNRSRV